MLIRLFGSCHSHKSSRRAARRPPLDIRRGPDVIRVGRLNSRRLHGSPCLPIAAVSGQPLLSFAARRGDAEWIETRPIAGSRKRSLKPVRAQDVVVKIIENVRERRPGIERMDPIPCWPTWYSRCWRLWGRSPLARPLPPPLPAGRSPRKGRWKEVDPHRARQARTGC